MGVFSKWWAVQRLPSSKIPDGIFLQAGLAVLAFRARPQTKTSLRLSNPAATPSSWCCYCPQQQKKYPHLPGVFSKWWAVQDLNLWPFACEANALPLRQLPEILYIYYNNFPPCLKSIYFFPLQNKLSAVRAHFILYTIIKDKMSAFRQAIFI